MEGTADTLYMIWAIWFGGGIVILCLLIAWIVMKVLESRE